MHGKPPSSGEKPAKEVEGRNQQVQNLIKHLPKLLPRGSVPDNKSPLSVHPSTTLLAPQDTSASPHLLPITVTTLPQQKGGPLPVMILPSTMSLSYSDRDKATAVTVATSAAPTPVVQRARSAAPKRPVSEPPAVGTDAPPKRKRGRPRKPRPEDAVAQQQQPVAPPPPPTPPSLPLAQTGGGVIQKALASSSTFPPTTPSSSSQLLEIVIQDQHQLVLGSIPTTLHDATVSAPDQRAGVVVQCQSASAPGLDADPRPVLLLQSSPATPGRSMVIQRAPGGQHLPPAENRVPPLNPLLPPAFPPATIQDDGKEVEITLTPVDISEALVAPAQPSAVPGCSDLCQGERSQSDGP